MYQERFTTLQGNTKKKKKSNKFPCSMVDFYQICIFVKTALLLPGAFFDDEKRN